MKKITHRTLFGVLIALLYTLTLPLTAKADDYKFLYLQLVDDAGNQVDNVYWGHNYELTLAEVTSGSGIYFNSITVYSNDAWITSAPRFLLYDNVTYTSDYTYNKTNATVIGASTDEPQEVVDKFIRYKGVNGAMKPFQLRNPAGQKVAVYYNSNTGRLVIDDFDGQFIAKSSFTTDASYEDDLTDLSAKKVRYLSQVDIPAGAFDITLKPQLYWYDNANDYKLSFDTDGFALNYPDYISWNCLHLTCDNWAGGHILSYGSGYGDNNYFATSPTSISFCRIESLNKLYLDAQTSDFARVPGDAEIAAWDTFLTPNPNQPGVFKTTAPVSCAKFAIYLNMGSKYSVSNNSYAARIYDEGDINHNTGFSRKQASYIYDFIQPIDSRDYLHWTTDDGSAVDTEFTVDLINQEVTVYANPEQYSYDESTRFKEDALYLIGSPQGWNINSDEMKLVKTENQTYKGTFYIYPGEFMLRFYSELGSWDNGSIGSQDDFNPLSISMSNGCFSGDVTKGGMGSWTIEDWEGGYVRFEVFLSYGSQSVTFTKVVVAEKFTPMETTYELPATVAVSGSVANQQDASDTLTGDGKGVYTYTYELPAGTYDILFADYAEGPDAPYYYGANYDGRPALDSSVAEEYVSTRKSVNEPNCWSLTLDVNSSVTISLDVNKNCVKFSKKAVAEGGVSTVLVDDIEPLTEYYDLRGIRISHPTDPGIYIKRNGSHAEKVLVK